VHAPTSPAPGEAPPASRLPPILLGLRRWHFAGLLTIGVVQGLLAVVWSLAVGELLRRAGQDRHGALVLCGMLAALAAVTAVALIGERVLAERLGQSWVNEVRVTVFERITRSPVRDHRRSTGATTLRLVGDASALRRWASLGLARLAVAVPMAAGALTALVVIAPQIGIVVGTTIIGGTVATGYLNPRLREADRSSRRRRARIAAHVTERVANRQVMQAFGQEQAEIRRLERQGTRLGRTMIKRAGAIGAIRAAGEATTLLAMVAALTVAAVDTTAIADLAAIMAVLGMLATPLRDLTRVSEYHASARVAREKLNEVLARPVRQVGRSVAPSGTGRLVLDGVCLEGLFGPLHAVAEAGAVVTLAGPNGAGKSTLLSIIAGLEIPSAGAVLLDGAPLHDIDPAELRRQIGLVTPDLPLLRGSIADNVRYSAPQSSDEELHDAVRLSGLDDVIKEHPDGLRTRVGEGGTGLSTGQRQRVALARALLPKPQVLLLDEADAHLDTAARAAIDRVLSGFEGTAILVTHRPSSFGSASARWTLDSGRLRVEQAEPAWPR
jgi:ABC-type multidrug transport system fused ATPase/permease subunit